METHPRAAEWAGGEAGRGSADGPRPVWAQRAGGRGEEVPAHTCEGAWVEHRRRRRRHSTATAATANNQHRTQLAATSSR